MPKSWLYFIALSLLIVIRVLLLNTVFTDWLWYHHYTASYYFLSALSVQPLFLQLVGGWPLPVFIVTVFIYWTTDESDDDMGKQFLMLPVAYVPFAIIGTALANLRFDPATLYAQPLMILPCGYVYILFWAVCIWAFDKLRLVI